MSHLYNYDLAVAIVSRSTHIKVYDIQKENIDL